MKQPHPHTPVLISLLVTLGHAAAAEAHWPTGENVQVKDTLFPHLHASALYGQSSGQEALLATGHHDPSSKGITLNMEGGLSLRTSEHLEGFTTYSLRWDNTAQTWEGEPEEWFLKLTDLPGGLELRGGQFLNRFGQQNTLHNHGWDYVDQNLVNGTMLGADGLATQGAEITWTRPIHGLTWTSFLTASAGRALTHEEDALSDYGDWLYTANWTNLYRLNDFHAVRAGLSYAYGDNQTGEAKPLYGGHLEYQWRANGLESGGNYLRGRSELQLRAGRAAITDAKWGISTSVLYGLETGRMGTFESGVRYDYVERAPEGMDERWRLSPSITWLPFASRTISFRVQYNLDHSSTGGVNHGIWAQVGINWGGSEVR
jgi:hypothetical protein